MRKILLTVMILSASIGVQAQSKDMALAAIKKATQFMIDEVSYKGGFVWEYTPDLSRQVSELETFRTMASTQDGGTADMGQALLDIYRITGDEYYYRCAEKCAEALIWGQLPCGGWNYLFDFAGENSLRHWYATVGANAWLFNEYNHYYGNATFDDHATSAPTSFLMRIYLEKLDPKYRFPLEKAIGMIVRSQYPAGGWPQRYPLRYDFPEGAVGERKKDYTSFLMFNDNIHFGNLGLLLSAYKFLGMGDLYDNIVRAMDCVAKLQTGGKTPGWAEQYDPKTLKIEAARYYEPAAIHTRNTGDCIEQLMNYYQFTGDEKYLAGIPKAIEWLKTVRLDLNDKVVQDSLAGHNLKIPKGYSVFPRDIEQETNRPLTFAIYGTNVNNTTCKTIAAVNYGYLIWFDLEKLEKRYNDLRKMDRAEAVRNSPLLEGTGMELAVPSINELNYYRVSQSDVADILLSQHEKGYWLAPFKWYPANKFTVHGSREIPAGTPKYLVRPMPESPEDPTDTGTYKNHDKDLLSISTFKYFENVSKLLSFYFPEMGKAKRDEALPW